MLTSDIYNKGKAINEQLKYNIDYNKSLLFDVICAGLASKLLASQFADTLTEEQVTTLNKIVNA